MRRRLFPDDEHIRRCRKARLAALEAIAGFTGKDAVGDTEFANLFGCESYQILVSAMRNDTEIVRKMEMLCGVNGFVVYKMIKAKSDETI